MKIERVNPVVVEKNVSELLKALCDANIDEKLKSQIIQTITDQRNLVSMQKRVAILMEANLSCTECALKGGCLSEEYGRPTGGCIADFYLLEESGKCDDIFFNLEGFENGKN